jgi:hypothetical protein
MAGLDKEIATFERMRPDLEKHHSGKFVLIHGEDLVGTFDTEDTVIREGLRLFGRGPFLVRKVGEQPMRIPVSAHQISPANAHR